MNTKNASHFDTGSERGAALVVALFLITILTVLGMLVLNTSIVETKMASNQKTSSQVFYAAEGGLDRGLQVLVADMEVDTGIGGPWGNVSFPASAGSVTAAYVNGSTSFDPAVRSVDMYRDGDSASKVRRLTFTNGGTSVGNSSYELYIYSPGNSEVYLLSYASGPQGVAAVEYHLDTDDLSPYNNAVFSGTGVNPEGDGVNLNISGSLYTNGQVQLSGNSTITNNYTDGGIGASLASMLPPVTGLNTNVRVKGGNLTLTDNAQIGTATASPPGAVNNIQVDVNFNSAQPYYANNVGTDVPNIQMPTILSGLEAQYPGISSSATYSGISNLNDRAWAIYKDLIRGQNGFAPSGTYADPNATVTSQGVVLDNSIWDCHDGGEWKTGKLSIRDCTANFSYLDSLGNGIAYDAATKVVTFTGMVLFSDEFKMDVTGGLTYVSKGAFIDSAGMTTAPTNQNQQAAMVIAQKELEIKSSFTPDNGGYLQGGNMTNSIGFVGGQEIELEPNGGANATITGFFYTPGEMKVEHTVQVAGTLIGGQFEAEDNASIFQVPALKNYLPTYMPGAQTIVALRNREWRRVY